MVLRLVRQTVTSISAAAAVRALRMTSISTGPSGTAALLPTAPRDERAGRAEARRPSGRDEMGSERLLHDGGSFDAILLGQGIPVPDRQFAPPLAVEDAARALAGRARGR